MLPNRITALIVTTLLVIGCASSPTGRPQLAFKSEREMRQMGEQAFTQIKAQTPLSRDGQAIRIVLCVAEAITSRLPAEQRGAGWEVLVFDGNAVNAFALPGNKIGVYEGIFRAARNQDQLAAVIGHEVAHVTARHANERVSTTYAAQFGVNVAQAAAGGSGTYSGQMMGLLGAGATVGVILPFNRKQESEADIVGLDLMARAGFDPSQAVPLWENMARIGKEKPPEFLSTHPSDETRMKGLTNQIPESKELFDEAQAKGYQPSCGF
ncbi:MAG: M48 family metallopeptidase [Chromatiales bacterium]|jgi:predicted Zn-dependent protease|nr:M48 family metallopeptidase [Chromatiales bacterium]